MRKAAAAEEAASPPRTRPYRTEENPMTQTIDATGQTAVSTPADKQTRPATLDEIQSFLYSEARFLDDREFDRWLDCYHPEAEFWMPAWADDDQLTSDPQSEISLIYYANRGGLEDRVFRIKTDRSSATSLPETRTGHNITNVEIIGRRGSEVDVRFNWHTLTTATRTSIRTSEPRSTPLTLRYTACHHEQEGRPEKRLHPPRRGHLPHLTSERLESSPHELPDCPQFEDGVTRFVTADPNETVADAAYNQGSTFRSTAATVPAAPARPSANQESTTAATTSMKPSPRTKPRRASASPARWSRRPTSSCR